MSRWKRVLLQAGLVAFALWPAVHIGLVKGYDLNPWKLAGWGMYSAPQIPCHVRVSAFTPDEVGVYPLRTILPEVGVDVISFVWASTFGVAVVAVIVTAVFVVSFPFSIDLPDPLLLLLRSYLLMLLVCGSLL